MKVRYMKEKKPSDFYNSYFTVGKEYDVIADYRLRHSSQTIRDNGFIIKDDTNQERMVFLDEFKITSDVKNNTFVFTSNAE